MPSSSPTSDSSVAEVNDPAVLQEVELNDNAVHIADISSSFSEKSVTTSTSEISEAATFLTLTKTSPPFTVSEALSPLDVKQMTTEVIIQQCLQHQGYRTPELNEKLYLHHFGFPTITSHITPYCCCRVLYLSHNAISDLSPLAPLTQLDSLFISNNTLTTLETLPCLPLLRLLDVSHNTLREMHTMTPQTQLETLLVSHNHVKNIHDICVSFPALTSLDLGYNQIPSLEMVEQALAERSTILATLVLLGNPAQRLSSQSNSHYRKRIINFFSGLRFLDEYPIFLEERRVAEAFGVGGREEEEKMKRQIKAEENDLQKEQFKYFQEEREAVRARRNSCGRVLENTKYFEDNCLVDDVYIPCSASSVS